MMKFFGETTSRIVPKKTLQKMLTALRKSKLFKVEKDSMGYKVVIPYGPYEGQVVLQAMNGTRDYLVRLNTKLFDVESHHV
jgi:hypothetical protein